MLRSARSKQDAVSSRFWGLLLKTYRLMHSESRRDFGKSQRRRDEGMRLMRFEYGG